MAHDRSVWVVDDEPGLAATLASLLGAGGWRARSFEDGREALAECLIGPPPALLVSDLWMPHLTGAELAEQLRTRLATRCPYLIAISGSLDPSVAGMGTLFDATLEKPFGYDDLVSILYDSNRARVSRTYLRAVPHDVGAAEERG